ncbi:hypothetical protein WN51_02613 [Melipona quadrifasciata]|uniref:Uncharacterized protein n=1 Tax=Melipona quadrifasciata TaxID=166423 RepID=A0A0M8ZTD1_9HYME|nr:hypothetical protein WN51_02613 [Melipona quadrifasciata]
MQLQNRQSYYVREIVTEDTLEYLSLKAKIHKLTPMILLLISNLKCPSIIPTDFIFSHPAGGVTLKKGNTPIATVDAIRIPGKVRNLHCESFTKDKLGERDSPCSGVFSTWISNKCVVTGQVLAASALVTKNARSIDVYTIDTSYGVIAIFAGVLPQPQSQKRETTHKIQLRFDMKEMIKFCIKIFMEIKEIEKAVRSTLSYCLQLAFTTYVLDKRFLFMINLQIIRQAYHAYDWVNGLLDF